MKQFLIAVIAAITLASSIANAQEKPVAKTEMTDAEVKKIDKDVGKITLKHGEIKKLDMPAMTMVFQAKDATLLDKVKAGDKVKFTAEKSRGGYAVTHIEVSK